MIPLCRAEHSDVEAIRALVHDAYARWVPIMGQEPLPMLADYAAAVERHVIDLHHVDGALAALIEMRPTPDHLFIVNVAVAPAYQGRGLGRAMLTHAERFAAALGLGEMRLFTNKVMSDNVRLYERCGYRGTREEALRGGVVLHMSKTI